MYNRYIPPSKAKSAPQPAAASPPPPAPQESTVETSHVQVSGSVPASSYARYVPPRKSKSAADTTQGATSLSNGLSPATKRKHEGVAMDEASPAPETKKTKTNRQSPEPGQLKDPASPKADKKKKHKSHSLDGESGVDGKIEAEDDASEAGDRSDKKKDQKKRRDKTRQEKEELQMEEKRGNDKNDTSDAESKPAGSKGANATHNDGADDDTQSERKQKKEKRDKPKKKKEQRPEDEEVSSRHASVLAKKDKALQIAPPDAPEIELDGEDMDVDGPLEPPEDVEMHGLEPLPQPAPVAIDTTKPSFETLPTWLAAPIRVAPDTRTPFSELGIHPKASKVLEAKGFKDAFAVQTAAVPLLLPSCKHRQGDLLLAAATGSGKTLAYALPIARDISQGSVTKLRALVVLPTRELVHQAQEVFHLCANAFDGRDQKRVRVGTSIGSQHLKQDQANLVEKIERYDSDAYRQAVKRDRDAWKISEESDSDSDSDSEGRSQEKHVAVGNLPDHVVDYNSKVDVLICTPGRLVDHINHTPGFTLDYVRWLVVDEADKLLAQSFQGWLDVVMPKLRTDKFSARDFPDSNLSGVRKVILSATLTRDLSLLGGLQLRRPQLIVLEGDQGAAESTQGAEHTLPTSLKEFAVRVYDPSLKPLYLLDLLQGEHLLSPNDSSVNPDTATSTGKDVAASDKSSAEDSSETSSSGSDSESDSESDTSSDASSTVNSAAAADKASTPAAFQKTVLVFTKSNEAALRLSRLLSLLSPSLTPLIATLTSTQKTSQRRRILSSFSAGTLRILVASDLVARGIDLPSLDNVINYDLPASAAGYVHRVGRTARAGRRGRALTLVETKESGWFWGAVGKWAGIRRSEDVGRLRIGDAEADHGGFSEESVEAYQKALDQLGREAKPTR